MALILSTKFALAQNSSAHLRLETKRLDKNANKNKSLKTQIILLKTISPIVNAFCLLETNQPTIQLQQTKNFLFNPTIKSKFHIKQTLVAGKTKVKQLKIQDKNTGWVQSKTLLYKELKFNKK